MKKLNLKNRLSLNKETLIKLNDAQMSSVKGQGSSGPKCTCNRNSCNKETEAVL